MNQLIYRNPIKHVSRKLTLRSDRFGKDDDAPVDLVADTDGSGADLVLLGDLDELLVLEQRSTGRTQGAVSLQEDTLVVAVLLQVVLRVVWVELDLVDGRDDFPGLGQVFEVGDGPV